MGSFIWLVVELGSNILGWSQCWYELAVVQLLLSFEGPDVNIHGLELCSDFMLYCRKMAFFQQKSGAMHAIS